LAGPTRMAQLEIQNLNIEYAHQRSRQRLLAVDNVSFSAESGQFVALVGPSGCGKTSILNAVAGLLPEFGGQIRMSGQPIHGPGRDRAMVFQSPALFPWRTVRRNVGYGLELQGRDRGEAKRKVQHYVELVGLQGFEESYPHELSGGMQQRVNLARALAVEPQVLLFDEPLSALDAQLREVMQMELQRVWLQTRNTALFVTHLISEAVFLADVVLVFSARPGRIKQVVRVDLPRPRDRAARHAPEFQRAEDLIWDAIKADVHV
jgi:NitT/TauT family transport system ATP-binding protein